MNIDNITKGLKALRSAMVRMGVFADILENEVDIADPAVFAGRCEVFAAVVEERVRQEEKFPGQQVPLSDEKPIVARDRVEDAREWCNTAMRIGTLTADNIFDEEAQEFREALALGDREAIRKEGVQVIAVILRILESDAYKALEGK